MRDFISIVNEGLIKVPPTLLDKITKEMMMRILWSLSEQATSAHPEDETNITSVIKQEAEAFGVDIPKKRLPQSDTVVIPLNLSGLPANYPEPKYGKNSVLRLVFYYQDESARTLAAMKADAKRIGGLKDLFDVFVMRKKASYEVTLVFFIKNVHNSMLRYVNDVNRSIDVTLHDALDNTKKITRHELQHVIQLSVFGLKFTKSTTRKEYLLNPAEFDPQISDAIYDMSLLIKIYNKKGKEVNIKDTIKKYIKNNEFFKTLYINDPDRFKIAVRKFYIGLANDLKQNITP